MLAHTYLVRSISIVCTSFLAVISTIGLAEDSPASTHPLPQASASLGLFADAFVKYDVILEPDQNAAEWWAGAPSVVRDKSGTFWLAARMRTPDAPRGLRGYELRFLKSTDGVRFEKVHSIFREDVPVPGFERPALLIDPHTGKFKLFACCPWNNGPWSIIRFDDVNSPKDFDPKSARVVLSPIPKRYERDIIPIEYKNPVIYHDGHKYHCYVIGVMRQTERIYHFTSADGEAWAPVGSPYESIMDLSGWHDFYVRPASILPTAVGYYFIYEGSSVQWFDPVYNIATGIGFTFDLHTIQDLTPEAPLAVSTTPSPHFATLRYSSWLNVNDETWIYAEATRPNESHEIRLFRIRQSNRQ